MLDDESGGGFGNFPSLVHYVVLSDLEPVYGRSPARVLDYLKQALPEGFATTSDLPHYLFVNVGSKGGLAYAHNGVPVPERGLTFSSYHDADLGTLVKDYVGHEGSSMMLVNHQGTIDAFSHLYGLLFQEVTNERLRTLAEIEAENAAAEKKEGEKKS